MGIETTSQGQRASIQNRSISINPGVALPGLFLTGVVILMVMTRSFELLDGYVNVPVAAGSQANYGRDPFDLSFIPINPDILDLIGLQGMQTEGLTTDQSNTPEPTSTSQPNTPTPTGELATATEVTATSVLPTLPLPTDPLPTVSDPILPLPTLPLPELDPTEPLEIVPTLIAPVVTLLP